MYIDIIWLLLNIERFLQISFVSHFKKVMYLFGIQIHTMAWRNAIKLSKNGHPQSLTNIKQNLAINAIQKKEKDSEKVSDVIIKIDT